MRRRAGRNGQTRTEQCAEQSGGTATAARKHIFPSFTLNPSLVCMHVMCCVRIPLQHSIDEWLLRFHSLVC